MILLHLPVLINNNRVETKFISLAEYKQTEKKKWEEKDPRATLYTLGRIWFEGGSDFDRKPEMELLDGISEKDRRIEWFRKERG